MYGRVRVGDDGGSIFKDIAMALLDKLGAEIWSKLFPDGGGLDDAFAALITEIQTLLVVEAISNDILLIEGLLKGVSQQLSVDYVNLKAQSGTTKAQLVAYLSDRRDDLETGVTGPLQTIIQNEGTNSKSNAQQSLLIFLTGGSALFSVLQEMALQDPTVTDPSSSQYAADLKTYAATFASVAAKLLADTRQSRLDAVSDVVTPSGLAIDADREALLEGRVPPDPGSDPEFWPGGTHGCEFQVQDGWTGTTTCDFTSWVSIWQACVTTDAYSNATSCRATYYAAAGPTFDTDSADSTATIATWTTLSTNPLGT